jgi:hypothetical protein
MSATGDIVDVEIAGVSTLLLSHRRVINPGRGHLGTG